MREFKNYKIVIDTSTFQLFLYEDKKIIKIYPVAVGKKTTPTPKGTFIIINKAPDPGGPFGSYWMGLSIRGYGIHGTNDNSSIGKAISHGCIRMYNTDINDLSRIVPLGTVVKIL